MVKNLQVFLKSKDGQILKQIFILFLGWRIILTFIELFGLSILPISTGHYQTSWAIYNTDLSLKWANWDGGHFRGVAENGYLYQFQIVFFPLYPLLIKFLMLFGLNSLWAGLLISNLCLIAALFYLYKLVRFDYDENIAGKVVFLTLAFPLSFYLTSVYSESLFLLLVILAFLQARQKNWVLAFLFAGLSAVTRLSGLIVIFVIAIEYLLRKPELPIVKYSLSKLSNYINFKKILAKPGLYFLFSLIPFSIFCLYLYIFQNNPLAFIDQEYYWHRHLTYPWNTLVNYIQNLWNFGLFKVGSGQALFELIFFIFFLGLLGMSYFKLRASYTIYFALSLLLPISTGTLQAIYRYGLVIFPIFILLALIKNQTYYQLWLFFSLTFLGILTVLFINSYWVS